MLVPEKMDVELSAEFENILKWATDNYMIVNVSKTKDIVFHRPSAYSLLPPVLTGIELVVSAKLLGVTFCHNLKYNDHVKTFLLFAASDVTYLSVSLLRSLIGYCILCSYCFTDPLRLTSLRLSRHC